MTQASAASQRRLGQWRDLIGTFDEGSGASALTFEQYRSAPFSTIFMRHDQDDTYYGKYQAQHDFLGLGQLNLHVHDIGMSTWVPGPATKDVAWEHTYAWCPVGQALPDVAGWTAPTVVLQSLSPADQFVHKAFTIVSVTPPAIVIANPASCFFCVRVRRLGNTGVQDTYNDNKVGGTVAANLAILQFDCHYQSYKHGTTSEFGP